MSSGDLTARGGDLSVPTGDPGGTRGPLAPRPDHPSPASSPGAAPAPGDAAPSRWQVVDLRPTDGDPGPGDRERVHRARLRVPAETRSLRLVRLLVAGVAADLGFTVDQVEDLRVAVDEACGALLAALDPVHVDGGDLCLAVDEVATAGATTVEVAAWADPPVEPVVDTVPALLLQHTTDGWTVEEGRLRFHRTAADTHA